MPVLQVRACATYLGCLGTAKIVRMAVFSVPYQKIECARLQGHNQHWDQRHQQFVNWVEIQNGNWVMHACM